MGLLLVELQYYPDHIRDVVSIKDQLETFGVSPGDVSDVQGTGWLVILMWGIFFRLWAFLCIELLKYAEGSGFVSRMIYLVIKYLRMSDLGSICGRYGPKPQDVEDHCACDGRAT